MAATQHMNYFALEKACKEDGCPLCRIVTERCEKYIDNMLFEHVSDRGFRKQYREAGGFCAEHSKNLESFRDGLAVAILGVDILTTYIEDFSKRKVRARKALCPACAERNRIENEFLTFIAGIKDSSAESDQKLIECITASSGLCVPHYAKLVSLVRKVPAWLREFQEERYRSLRDRSQQFVECSAWGRQKEFNALSDADKLVWKEIALALRSSCRG